MKNSERLRAELKQLEEELKRKALLGSVEVKETWKKLQKEAKPMQRFWILCCLALVAGLASAQSVNPRMERVLTAEDQAALTPDAVLQQLKEGNERFGAGELTVRDHTAQVRKAVSGQYPKALVLSCVDSRVPVEDVLDRGIGDVFVARVAGNFENVDILGSAEFATKVAGAKLVLVLGHEHCGAVKSAIDGAELGNITEMLQNIMPAVASLAYYKGEKTSKNEEFVHMVAEKNVRLTVDDMRKRSSILKDLESQGRIKIVGALYDMDSGAIEFLD